MIVCPFGFNERTSWLRHRAANNSSSDILVAYNSVSSHAKIRYSIASGGEFSPFK